MDPRPPEASSDSQPRQPRKIAIISAEYPPETAAGGIGTYAATVAPALARAGCEVTVVSRSLNGSDSLEQRDGVRLLRLVDLAPPEGFWAAPFEQAHVRAAQDYYQRAYTVAVAFMTMPELAGNELIEVADWGGEGALLRAALADTPIVVRFHTPARLVARWNGVGQGADRGFWDALHALETMAVSNASAWTCPSQWMARPCEELFGLVPGSVQAIPNPFDAAAFAATTGAAAAIGHISPNAVRGSDIVTIGRVEARKGVVEGAHAIAKVLALLPEARWVLAGADTRTAPDGGSMARFLRALLPEDLRGRVVVTGSLPREQLPALLSHAGVVFLPSRHENFPYTCLEAMATGAPVVASKHGGMAEMVQNGWSGLLSDPADADATAKALLRVLLQPCVAETLGRGAAAAVKRFDPDAVAARLHAQYANTVAAAAAEVRS